MGHNNSGISRPTLRELATRLNSGAVTSRELVEESLAIADTADSAVWTQRYDEAALALAGEIDRQRQGGADPGEFAGIPVAIKDLFDLAGSETLAGSVVLRGRAAATESAPAVERLRQHGLIVIGKTNMTEFAYSGLGINPHLGTPANPADTTTPRIPGGSSSGSAVAVATGAVPVAIGTDTGGSIRIPASLCGLVGFKPSARAVPAEGLVPLSTTFDSIGPLANSVQCCADIHAMLTTQTPSILGGPDRPVRCLVPTNVVRDAAEAGLLQRFDNGIGALASAGILDTTESPLALFDEVLASGIQGTIAAYEGWQWHRDLVERGAVHYDPRVLSRLRGGADIPEALYRQALADRARLIGSYQKLMQEFDAILLPTTAISAPPLADFADDDFYVRTNQLILRNTSIGNSLDTAAISLPLPPTADSPLPAGMMIMRPGGQEQQTLEIALTLERELARVYLTG